MAVVNIIRKVQTAVRQFKERRRHKKRDELVELLGDYDWSECGKPEGSDDE